MKETDARKEKRINIIKRNGMEVPFDSNKIRVAIGKANSDMPEAHKMTPEEIESVVLNVTREIMECQYSMSVEEIQNIVEMHLMDSSKQVAQKYIRYRYIRELARKANSTDDSILSLLEYENEEVKQENSNKDPIVASVQRDYMAGEVSKDLSRRIILPEDVVKAHDEGIIHFHDMDYFSQRIFNCCLVNLEDMLQNGTVISGVKIDTPKSFQTACTVATQIIAVVASNQYGGQTISLTHLVPFVEVSRQKYISRFSEMREKLGLELTDEQIKEMAEIQLRKEIEAGLQTMQYQCSTLMTTNGQAPFITVNMYLNEARDEREKADLAMLIEAMLRTRILGVKNEKGIYVTPAFPKLIYVTEEDNIHEDSKYYYLTELAAECTAKRMVPDYVSEKMMLQMKVDENKEGHCYPPMGCRSFLTPYVDDDGNPKYYGRFNQGVVTINLPDVALSSKGDMDRFWEIYEERLELCHKALRCRHERLKGTSSDISPIHWQYGAIARLKRGEKIDKLLYGGYSTISLGYAGLYETVMYMTGSSHTGEGKEFALAVMQKLNDKCAEWKDAENIAYSVYGTPLESTTYKFAKAIQKRHGVVKDVSDHNYVTNSFHVCVREDIDAFTKLKFESEFQRLSPGGTISYIEVPKMFDNIDALLSIIKYMYDTIMYAEVNTKSDYCQKCGYSGEIVIETNDAGKLIWKCPNCGCTDQSLMNVARRTCGYIGTQYWNQGRTQEIKDRVCHVANDGFTYRSSDIS